MCCSFYHKKKREGGEGEGTMVPNEISFYNIEPLTKKKTNLIH
jgi:hypothetical protein